jgi:hypothetical protein
MLKVIPRAVAAHPSLEGGTNMCVGVCSPQFVHPANRNGKLELERVGVHCKELSDKSRFARLIRSHETGQYRDYGGGVHGQIGQHTK